jgi:hypothetical protein
MALLISHSGLDTPGAPGSLVLALYPSAMSVFTRAAFTILTLAANCFCLELAIGFAATELVTDAAVAVPVVVAAILWVWAAGASGEVIDDRATNGASTTGEAAFIGRAAIAAGWCAPTAWSLQRRCAAELIRGTWASSLGRAALLILVGARALWTSLVWRAALLVGQARKTALCRTAILPGQGTSASRQPLGRRAALAVDGTWEAVLCRAAFLPREGTGAESHRFGSGAALGIRWTREPTLGRAAFLTWVGTSAEVHPLVRGAAFTVDGTRKSVLRRAAFLVCFGTTPKLVAWSRRTTGLTCVAGEALGTADAIRFGATAKWLKVRGRTASGKEWIAGTSPFLDRAAGVIGRIAAVGRRQTR